MGTPTGARWSYLKFDVSIPTGHVVTSTTLRVHFSKVPTAPVELRAVPDNAWTEGQITWANKPVPGALVETKSDFGTGYVTFNLGRTIASGSNSFVLQSPSSTSNFQIRSREDATTGSRPLLTVNTSMSTTTTTVPNTTTTVARTEPHLYPSGLLDKQSFIYGSEIGAWRVDGRPAVDLTTPIPQKVTEAGIPVVRHAVYDCFTDQKCGSDNHAGTLMRSNLQEAVLGIANNLRAVPWLKLLPIARAAIGSAPAGTVFCPPWTGPADQNLAIYKSQLDTIRVVYSGPIVIESSNEMDYTCWALWRSQNDGVTPGSAGAAGVSKRIGQHFAQTMPQVKAYARSLGFSEVISVGYVGVAGGTNWGQSCTADASKPYGYACTYSPSWVSEFNTAVRDAYVAAGSTNRDYIPDVLSIHAYPHSPDFALHPYEFDDNIAFAYYRNWIIQSRNVVNSIWGPSLGPAIRFSVSEWNAGVSRNTSDDRWSGWDSPSRVQAFYDGWLRMLRGDGNTTGSGTRYWSANVFLIASNSDTSVGGAYNIVRLDGSTPAWYDTFRTLSVTDPNR